MRITITGPRSVGKTTTAILLAEQLGYDYVSGDEVMDKELKPFGGLEKCMKDERDDIINNRILPCARKALQQEKTIFDQAGGALTVEENNIGEEFQQLLRTKTFVIGLLPSMNDEQAIGFLFQRERHRPHFHHVSDEELKAIVQKHYRKVKQAIHEVTKHIIYTARLNPQEVIDCCKDIIKGKSL
ncbi:hypothetical protein GF367_01355 [Candidatus Woesearchaeota archaeon]|nr:hypothetical protein [Candidatus Woesearchaeota archaeon]